MKTFNPKAKAWVLGDLNQELAEQLASHEFVFSTGIKGKIKAALVNKFFRNLDIYSLETKKYIKLFQPLFERKGWKCLTYFPCGWDEDNPNSSRDCFNKEHVILSCARFGTYQKNTEMLLEGIAKTDLKDWTVYLVGPITSGFDFSSNHTFSDYLKNYFETYPHLKEKVIFTGPIFETKDLFSYFRRAQVFVMTSRYEGFANVFSQARWNQCNIVSTDVGGACDMSDGWKYGICVGDNDIDALSRALEKFIDTPNEIQRMHRRFSDGISYNNIIPTYILKNNEER